MLLGLHHRRKEVWAGSAGEARERRGAEVSLASGVRLGSYEVLGRLGAGGMGEVYRARDPRLGREIALKVLPAELSSNVGRLKRFEKEARSASALNPNIFTI
jgi:serine/threonine protein kinase